MPRHAVPMDFSGPAVTGLYRIGWHACVLINAARSQGRTCSSRMSRASHGSLTFLPPPIVDRLLCRRDGVETAEHGR